MLGRTVWISQCEGMSLTSLTNTTVDLTMAGDLVSEGREGRMLEEISGMYSDIFGSQSGPHRDNHPVVFLPDGSKKGCVESGGMSAMGYLAFVVSGKLK